MESESKLTKQPGVVLAIAVIFSFQLTMSDRTANWGLKCYILDSYLLYREDKTQYLLWNTVLHILNADQG